MTTEKTQRPTAADLQKLIVIADEYGLNGASLANIEVFERLEALGYLQQAEEDDEIVFLFTEEGREAVAAALAAGARIGYPRFIDNGDGTITDTQQGVMWTQDTLCDAPVNLDTAEQLCADCRIGGYSDWQVPDFDPLHSLVDRTRCEPAIDVAIFPDTRYMTYWSRTPVAWAPRAAWFVGFNHGLSNGYHRGYNGAFVRACRALPAG